MIPRQENTLPPPNISKVIDLASKYNQSLLFADLTTPYMWLNEGCDMELDVLPAMTEVIKRRDPRKSKISTFSYFTNPVLAARDKRMAAPKIAKLTEPPSKEALAKSYAWKRKRGMWLNSGEERILDEYEQQNGRIEI